MGPFVMQSKLGCGELSTRSPGVVQNRGFAFVKRVRRAAHQRTLRKPRVVRVVAFEQASLGQRPPVVDFRKPNLQSVSKEYAWREDFYEQYQWIKKLNSGSFGEVWLACDLETGRDVAVKELKSQRGRLTPERVKQKVEQELRVMDTVGSSPRVVKLMGGYLLQGHYEIVMEHCAGLDLKYHTKDYGPFSEQLTAAVAYEILNVLRVCHDNDIVHGDVKTSNFMVKSPKCNPLADKNVTMLEPGWLKAIDFGCSQYVPGGRRIHNRVGTPVYMAPEVFTRDFGKESDLWSLGVILFQLMSGTFPFWRTADDALMCSINEVSHTVQSKPVDFASRAVWQNVSKECKHFIRRLLCKDYTKRMTLSDAERHPFLSKNIHLDSEGNVMLASSNIVEYNACKMSILQ